jgi:tetratricopeptide (TPR) repeat protein
VQRVIIANARYWLDYLNGQPEDAVLADADIRGAARALEAVMTVPEVWPCTQSLVLALHPHMERQGYWADWDEFLRGLTFQARQQADAAAEEALLIRRGAIQQQRGTYPAAIVTFRRAWWLCRQIGDRPGLARAFSNLSSLYRLQGRFERAVILCQAALALFEALGDTVGLARAENHLGLIYLDQGCWSDALPHLTRSKVLLQQVGDRPSLAKTLQNLGVLYQSTGELETALDYLTQAIHLHQAVGDEIHAARTLLNVGNVYLSRDDLPQAELAYSQAEALLQRAGDSLDLARARHNLGMVYTRLKNWTEAEACFERALERWRSLENPWNLANTLGELTGLYLACGAWSKARVCLDEAWKLVGERHEAHFHILQRELTERRQELHRLTGPDQHESEVDPAGNPGPTSPIQPPQAVEEHTALEATSVGELMERVRASSTAARTLNNFPDI